MHLLADPYHPIKQSLARHPAPQQIHQYVSRTLRQACHNRKMEPIIHIKTGYVLDRQIPQQYLIGLVQLALRHSLHTSNLQFQNQSLTHHHRLAVHRKMVVLCPQHIKVLATGATILDQLHRRPQHFRQSHHLHPLLQSHLLHFSPHRQVQHNTVPSHPFPSHRPLLVGASSHLVERRTVVAALLESSMAPTLAAEVDPKPLSVPSLMVPTLSQSHPGKEETEQITEVEVDPMPVNALATPTQTSISMIYLAVTMKHTLGLNVTSSLKVRSQNPLVDRHNHLRQSRLRLRQSRLRQGHHLLLNKIPMMVPALAKSMPFQAMRVIVSARLTVPPTASKTLLPSPVQGRKPGGYQL